ncbi:MAG: phosphonatase-like hydrolase [Desulfobacteraceae bacterium]|nr:phosphonatase-like hydrolase [Desulfobacteraceae bacterium]
MSDMELVVFDMAGTTFEDSGQVPGAFTAVLHAHGIDVTADELTAVRGASKREAICRFVERRFPGSEVEVGTLAGQIFDDFRAHLAESYAQGGVRVLPGVERTFEWLHARGVKVALTTGFDRFITETVLGIAGWKPPLFDAVVCGDDVSRGRPAPYLIFHAMEATGTVSVRRVACVGDTALDLEAGCNAGVLWNIGVLSGAHGRDRLERAPHTHIVEGVAALPALWEA